MRFVSILFTSLFIIGVLNSCDERKAEKSDNNPVESKQKGSIPEIEIEKKTVDTVSPEVIVSRYNYDTDFDLIKTAILANDAISLTPWCTGQNVSADEILMFFQDPKFASLLKESTYDSLVPMENEFQEIELIWSGECSFTDEDENTFESGLYLYFKQGDTDLELIKVLAAG